MLRHTSVVMTTMGALELIDVSPVARPTLSAPYSSHSSRYFWFDSALMGVV